MSDFNFVNLRNTNSDEKQRLFFIVFVSVLFLAFWNFFTSPSEDEIRRQQEMLKNKNLSVEKNQEVENSKEKQILKRDKKEIFLKNKNVHIGFDVANNKITFLALKKYKQHEKSVKNFVLLDDDHFIESGWLGTYKNSEIDWKFDKKNDSTISIFGERNGIIFETTYHIDDNYGINIKQKIINNSNVDISVSNYSRAFIKDTTDRIENSYAFRGILMMNDGKIDEIKYEQVKKHDIAKNTKNNGWIGISDQYWITSLFSNSSEETIYTARYINNKDAYQIDISGNRNILLAGKTYEVETIALVAPKKLELLNEFSKTYNVEKIDKVIDFGMFYFLSKPLLIILKRLYSLTNNFGISIILLTILVRIIIFPFVNRSYKAMMKIKKITPRIKEIQEQYKEDKRSMQMATYELYKQENISPLSAIVPLLLQMPVFFALYKVLIISIEMRDAPFFGWIVDLSSKDPSSIFNLFGLLSFEVPPILQIGVLPIVMGVTMWLQQLLQPLNVGVDQTQQKIIKWLPVIFTVLFASMPAGLVLYWSCSNIFTIIQQTVLLKIIYRERQ